MSSPGDKASPRDALTGGGHAASGGGAASSSGLQLQALDDDALLQAPEKVQHSVRTAVPTVKKVRATRCYEFPTTPQSLSHTPKPAMACAR